MSIVPLGDTVSPVAVLGGDVPRIILRHPTSDESATVIKPTSIPMEGGTVYVIGHKFISKDGVGENKDDMTEGIQEDGRLSEHTFVAEIAVMMSQDERQSAFDFSSGVAKMLPEKETANTK